MKAGHWILITVVVLGAGFAYWKVTRATQAQLDEAMDVKGVDIFEGLSATAYDTLARNWKTKLSKSAANKFIDVLKKPDAEMTVSDKSFLKTTLGKLISW